MVWYDVMLGLVVSMVYSLVTFKGGAAMGPTLLNYQNAGSSCNFLLCCEYFEEMDVLFEGMIEGNFCKCYIF